MATPISENLPPEQALAEIVRRLHNRWRLVITLPLLYLLVGLWMWNAWILPDLGGNGLITMSDGAYIVLSGIGGAFVFVMWRLLERFRLLQFIALTESRKSVNLFLDRASRYQMLQYAVCDVVTLLGLLFFVMRGDVPIFLAFIFLGMVFYLRSIPSEKRLGRAMFAPIPGA